MNEIPAFALDARLAADCHILTNKPGQTLLLMNNALVPWFILVPHTAETEIARLPQDQQAALWKTAGALGRVLLKHMGAEKINTATIGNVVNQLHIHIVGRRADDFCWPDVVWGQKDRVAYDNDAVNRVRNDIGNWLRQEL